MSVDGERFWLNMNAEATCSSSCLFVGKKRSRMGDDAWKGKRSEAEGEPRPCTECGKKFWSWKALFGHMRCHPERQWRGINPPPNLMRAQEQPRDEQVSVSVSMSMTQEDHEVAACLLLLANANGSCSDQFECSSCNKVFGSHQALGGHRASHKNVKGCFANSEENNNGHKCSICQRVFSTGQALGGHKRCHWDKPSHSLDLNLPPPSSSSSSPPLTLDLTLGL